VDKIFLWQKGYLDTIPYLFSLMETYIIKFGGSAITNKNEGGRLLLPTNLGDIKRKSMGFYRSSLVSRLIDEMREAHMRRPLKLLAFFNGAGPFGHDLVDERVWRGHGDPVLVQESVRHLHSLVKGSFLEEGIKLEEITPHNTCTYMGRKERSGIAEIKRFDFESCGPPSRRRAQTPSSPATATWSQPEKA
jgi:isopentenyl phosphate kinase